MFAKRTKLIPSVILALAPGATASVNVLTLDWATVDHVQHRRHLGTVGHDRTAGRRHRERRRLHTGRRLLGGLGQRM